LVWDVTVVSTLAQSYVDRAATGVGAGAEMAAERKLAKYSNLASNFTFQPIAVENLGAFSLPKSENRTSASSHRCRGLARSSAAVNHSGNSQHWPDDCKLTLFSND